MPFIRPFNFLKAVMVGSFVPASCVMTHEYDSTKAKIFLHHL